MPKHQVPVRGPSFNKQSSCSCVCVLKENLKADPAQNSDRHAKLLRDASQWTCRSGCIWEILETSFKTTRPYNCNHTSSHHTGVCNHRNLTCDHYKPSTLVGQNTKIRKYTQVPLRLAFILTPNVLMNHSNASIFLLTRKQY